MINMARNNYIKRFCPKCETLNNYNAHFCHICGEDLNKYPESETKIDLLDFGGKDPQDPKRKNTTKMQFRLLILEILIFIIAFVVYYYFL